MENVIIIVISNPQIISQKHPVKRAPLKEPNVGITCSSCPIKLPKICKSISSSGSSTQSCSKKLIQAAV